MPAKSEKQLKFMRAVANNPAFAKKVGVPQKVGKEFSMKKYAKGGITEYGGMEKYASKAAMKKHEKSESPAMEKTEKMIDKGIKAHEARMHKGGKKMAKGGGVEIKGKTKGRMV